MDRHTLVLSITSIIIIAIIITIRSFHHCKAVGSGDNPHGDDYIEFRSSSDAGREDEYVPLFTRCELSFVTNEIFFNQYNFHLFVSREFRLLLQTLRQFFEYYQAFDR